MSDKRRDGPGNGDSAIEGRPAAREACGRSLIGAGRHGRADDRRPLSGAPVPRRLLHQQADRVENPRSASCVAGAQRRYTTAPGTLMDAVLPTSIVQDDSSPAGYYIKVDLDTTDDDMGTPRVVAPGMDPYYVSGLNRIRWIRGGAIRIEPLASWRRRRGSVYVLDSGPAFDHRALTPTECPWTASSSRARQPFGAFKAPMTRMARTCGTSPSTRLTMTASSYPASYNRVQITYSYHADNGDITTIAIADRRACRRHHVWQTFYAPSEREIVPGSDIV